MFFGTLIYLHGFKSGPQSQKAKYVSNLLAEQQAFKGKVYVPDLGFNIHQAMDDLACYLTKAAPPFIFMGSSLGGYFATYLAETNPSVLASETLCKVILINPSMRPDELLCNYLGWVENIYTKARFELKPEYIDVLKAYRVAQVTHPERYLLLSKVHDEVLDYWQAVEYLKGAHMQLDAEGDHAFEDLPKKRSAILSFLELDEVYT